MENLQLGKQYIIFNTKNEKKLAAGGALIWITYNLFVENVYIEMGQGASTPGPPGKDGKDAVVDYIQVVNKTVNDEGFKNQIKGLLNDASFAKTATDYISTNAHQFKVPKGETEFKNLTADDQAKIINNLITDNMTTFSVALMSNQSFKDAILETVKANPSNFRGPQGVQWPLGVGIKSATYDETTGKLKLINTNDESLGEFSVKGAAGPVGPTGAAGNIQTPDNITWLQGKTMWCADGNCVVPGGNSIVNKLIRTGGSPDNQVGMEAQSQGIFAKSTVAAGTPSTLVQIADGTYPESGNPEMVFKGFQAGNAYSSGIRSGKGLDLQFITNGEVRAIMNNNGLSIPGDTTIAGKLIVNGRDILAELDSTIKVNDNLRLYSQGGQGYLKGTSGWGAGMTSNSGDNWGQWKVTKWWCAGKHFIQKSVKRFLVSPRTRTRFGMDFLPAKLVT